MGRNKKDKDFERQRLEEENRGNLPVKTFQHNPFSPYDPSVIIEDDLARVYAGLRKISETLGLIEEPRYNCPVKDENLRAGDYNADYLKRCMHEELAIIAVGTKEALHDRESLKRANEYLLKMLENNQ